MYVKIKNNYDYLNTDEVAPLGSLWQCQPKTLALEVHLSGSEIS